MFLHLLFGVSQISNYRILTPPLHVIPVPRGDFSSQFQLPVFDAAK